MFIVLEGIDGSGGGTQRKILEEYFKGVGEVLSLKYPHYEDGIGKTIKEFLYEKKELSPEHQFLLFAGQMALESPRIEKARFGNCRSICDLNYGLSRDAGIGD